MIEEVKNCFENAAKDDKAGKKHKGLLLKEPNDLASKGYLARAKKNLDLCDIYAREKFDYMIPEAWYYTLYYCALSILSKFGVESRNQRCTAAFLKYLKNHNLISYDEEFINRITVYAEKEEFSNVDEREKARYGWLIESKEIIEQNPTMIELCKKAISQAEEIVFSAKEFKIPEELIIHNSDD